MLVAGPALGTGRALRSNLPFAPRGLRVGERVEHELAPSEGRVHGEVSVPGPKADGSGCRTMTGAIAAVAKFGESDGDA